MANIHSALQHELSLMRDSSSRHKDGFSSDGVGQQYDILHEIREIRTAHQDLLAQYKIKVAVLQNDLDHARKEKENGMNSLQVVIEALTRTPAPITPSGLPPTPISQTSSSDANHLQERMKYEAEIERLRRENRSLKQKVGVMERDVEFSKNNKGETQGKEKDSDGFISRTDYRGLENVPTGPRLHEPQAPHLFPTPSQLVGSWGSPVVDLPTRPNSPTLGGSTGTSRNLGLSSFDIGMNSLEENLNDDGPPPFDFAQAKANNDDGFPEALVATLLPPKEFPELEKTIDEQLADEGIAVLSFQGPAPGVIKAGFELGGNKRGDEYDPATMVEAPRDYTRSRCLWRPQTSSFNSRDRFRVGEGTAFEIPKDLSFDDNLWTSVEEREEVIQANARMAREGFGRGRGERAFPEFFRYGIQYRPDETDSNFARTVHLSNLPEDAQLREVLPRVRGGEIFSASLLRTLKLTGGLTARIIFMTEGAAEEYVSYAAEHPITFGEDKKQATVRLIDTPTYPLNPSRSAGMRNREQSRCIAIEAFPEDISRGWLESTLACGSGYRAESLVENYIDAEGTLHLEFSSVDIAGSAFGILSSRRLHGSCPPRFEQDPCAGPLEQLKLGISPRPPMVPRQGLKGQSLKDKHSEGDFEVEQLQGLQRKKLAALSNQKVNIPSFSDAKFKNRAWADMTDDEEEEEEENDQLSSEVENRFAVALPVDRHDESDKSPAEQVNLPSTTSANQVVIEEKPLNDPQQPIGLAASKYADKLPSIERCGKIQQGHRRHALDSCTNSSSSLPAGPGLKHATEEVCRSEEVVSEYKFNTFTRRHSSQNSAVQSPQLSPKEVFDPARDEYGLADSRRSRSSPRVNLDDLIASGSERSDSPKSRSVSPEHEVLCETSPTYSHNTPTAFHFGAYHIGLHRVKTSESDLMTTVPFPRSRNDSSNSDETVGSSTSAQTPSHAGLDNLVIHENPLPTRFKDRKTTTFTVPPIADMHSTILDRRNDQSIKRKREVREEELDGLPGGSRTRLTDGREVQHVNVVNPDEIPLEDDEDEDDSLP